MGFRRSLPLATFAIALALALPASSFGAANIVASPTSYDFGAADGSEFPVAPNPVHNFTLTNTGDASASVHDAGFTGNATAIDQFRDYPGNCGGTIVLAPGASCYYQVEFDPYLEGVFNATLNIDTTDGVHPTIGIYLGGTGVFQSLAQQQTTIDFGDQGIFDPVSSKTATFSNVGPVAVGVNAAGLQPGSTQFTMTGTTCSGAIAPGAGCSATLAFAPGVLGAATPGVLEIDYNGGHDADLVTLTGAGVDQQFSGVANLVTFPDRAATTGPSQPLSESFTNDGTVPVTVDDVTIVGSDATEFALVDQDCTPGVAVSASCAASVVFMPASFGAKTATLRVSWDHGHGTTDIPLYGNALAPPVPPQTQPTPPVLSVGRPAVARLAAVKSLAYPVACGPALCSVSANVSVTARVHGLTTKFTVKSPPSLIAAGTVGFATARFSRAQRKLLASATRATATGVVTIAGGASAPAIVSRLRR